MASEPTSATAEATKPTEGGWELFAHDADIGGKLGPLFRVELRLREIQAQSFIIANVDRKSHDTSISSFVNVVSMPCE